VRKKSDGGAHVGRSNQNGEPPYSNSLFSMQISSILMWWACSKDVAQYEIPKITVDLKRKVKSMKHMIFGSPNL
jgi:hypothetical protein